MEAEFCRYLKALHIFSTYLEIFRSHFASHDVDFEIEGLYQRNE